MGFKKFVELFQEEKEEEVFLRELLLKLYIQNFFNKN